MVPGTRLRFVCLQRIIKRSHDVRLMTSWKRQAVTGRYPGGVAAGRSGGRGRRLFCCRSLSSWKVHGLKSDDQFGLSTFLPLPSLPHCRLSTVDCFFPPPWGGGSSALQNIESCRRPLSFGSLELGRRDDSDTRVRSYFLPGRLAAATARIATSDRMTRLFL
ncbi:hypothetical protein IscW_ISCW015734 [Ixodes scapularis]|uniref:Uncharacterized protein n=1 Tax=Ixodes scapularis TaxID=6945 RepID=B7P447_IXOSC|nr:hypothetical protein IscW_ISCW015734 [Ixodes scapularis]|eukprot:XP_002405272.1 hypothetical protein IscW_ISCW015734 [Ixodes scapularis]